MSASYALQVAVLERLETDADVGAIVDDRIFDGMPSGETYPLVTFGPSDASPVSDALACVEGFDVQLQLDCWSQDNGQLHPTRTLTDAVLKALHRAPLELATPYRLLTLNATNRVFLDRDQKTGHGVVTLEAEINEGSVSSL